MSEAASRPRDLVSALSCVANILARVDAHTDHDPDFSASEFIDAMFTGFADDHDCICDGNTHTTIAPPGLRSGEFGHVELAHTISELRILLTMSTWRHLASRLEDFWRSRHPSRYGLAVSYSDGLGPLLTDLARAQLRVLNAPFLDRRITGRLTALTAAIDTAWWSDDYLITAAKLAEASDHGHGLASRACRALEPLNKGGVKHAIVMSESIPRFTSENAAVSECLPHIFVAGDICSVRYVFVLSKVPTDLNALFGDGPKDNDVRLGIGKSKKPSTRLSVSTSGNRTSAQTPTIHKAEQKLLDVLGDDLDQVVISPTHAAHEFFGPRRLMDPKLRRLLRTDLE